jgi:flavin-dependent dehydrogenase
VVQKAKIKHYDVIICGAGPAGASASKFLSDAGLRVLVIDKMSLPRPKICAGGLNPRAYAFVRRHFGAIPQDIFSRPKSWLGLRAQFGKDYALHEFIEWNRHDKEQGYSASYPEIPNAVSCIWRDKFDYWLSQKSGAEIWQNCELIDFNVKSSTGVKVSVRDNYLIGADGAASKTRRLLDPTFDQSVSWFSIYEQWVEGSIELDPNWYYMFVGREFIDIFCSLFAKDGHLILSQVSRKGIPSAGGLESYIDFLKESYDLEIAKGLRRWGCVVNNMGATDSFYFGSGRVVLVGEAAGFIGFCGEGISGALISGKLAAEAIIENMADPAMVLERYMSTSLPLRERIHQEHEMGKMFPVNAYRLYGMLPDHQTVNPHM